MKKGGSFRGPDGRGSASGQVSVVPTAPGQAAAEGLEPGVGGNGQDQGLTQRMEDSSEPALAEAVGHGEPQGKDNGDLDPEDWVIGKEREEQKWSKEDGELEDLKKNKGAESAVESGIKVFGEAVPQVGKICIHPAADPGGGLAGTGAVPIENTKTGAAHFAGQGNVFHEVTANRRVSPDFFVGLTAKKEKLAVGGPQRWGSAADPVGKVEKDEEMNVRNGQMLAPAFGLQVGPKGKEVGFLIEGQLDGLGNGVLGKAGVGIHKQKEIPLGRLGELLAGPGFSSPVGGKILPLKQANPRVDLCKMPDHVGSAIGGVVVQDKDFKNWGFSREQALQAGLDSFLLVSGGNEDRDRWHGFHGKFQPREAKNP